LPNAISASCLSQEQAAAGMLLIEKPSLANLCLLRRIRPLLAQSRHTETDRYLSAFGGEADIHARVASTASVVNDPKRT
jgi:hypothetical protein